MRFIGVEEQVVQLPDKVIGFALELVRIAL